MPSKNKIASKPKSKDQMEDIIRCVCGQCKNDDLPMVACDRCCVWQHMDCTGYRDYGEDPTYLCEECAPDLHQYLNFGFKTHREYEKAKRQYAQLEPEHAVNGRRRSTASRSQASPEADNEYEPPQTRPNGNKKPIPKTTEAQSPNINNNNNSSGMKTPKRRISVSSLSGDEGNNRQQNGATSKRLRKTPAKKKNKTSSGSEPEAMSNTEEVFDGSDGQSEEKVVLDSIAAEVQVCQGVQEERDKAESSKIKKPPPKRTNSKSAAVEPEELTIEQMLERVRKMAQHVTRIEVDYAQQNGSVSDDDYDNRTTKKSTPKKSRTISSAIHMITPSPSVTTPESCATSPVECDGIATPTTDPSSSSSSAEKETQPTLIDLCEELMGQINRFEQKYGGRLGAESSRKALKI